MNSKWAPEDKNTEAARSAAFANRPLTTNPADVYVWWCHVNGILFDPAIVDQIRAYCNAQVDWPAAPEPKRFTVRNTLSGAPELSPSEQGRKVEYGRHIDSDPFAVEPGEPPRGENHGLIGRPCEVNLEAHLPPGAQIETIHMNGDTFARTGERREFGTGAHRDANLDKGRFDLLPWDAIEKVARHYQKGALTHGERNWERGIPLNILLDSAVRHLAKELDGRADEDHLTAAAWNVLCAIAIRLRCERGALPEELDNT